MKKVLAGILIICLIALGSYFLFYNQNGFDIKITNQTNKKMSGLYITYQSHIESNVKLPTISPGEEYKLHVTPPENFGEDAILLYYKDNKGNEHTEAVFGYIENGYSGNAVITLKSIDNNGVIHVDVKEKLD